MPRRADRIEMEVFMDDRIVRKKLEILNSILQTPLAELGPWEARRSNYLNPGQYEFQTEWEQMVPPSLWPALSTVFFKTHFEPVPLPKDTQGFLCFRLEQFESMASIQGRPYCGIDPHHLLVPAPREAGELMIEAFAVPSAQRSPGDSRLKAVFHGVSLVAIHTEEQRALSDLSYARLTLQEIEEGRRRSLLAKALEESLLLIDLTRSRDTVRQQTLQAGSLLRERLHAIGRDCEAGRLFYVGHTHIDTAWLWPIRETVRKCARTFSTACRLMESFPHFHFSCSQAQLFDYVKKYYPPLYEEIRGWIQEGRWHTTGGMWVETDCNVTSGESLVRQFLHGIEFFKREFGTRPRTCWLPDVFGYPASLPQILERSGIPYFFTYKLHWQARNPFPDHLFQWEGIDGTRVVGHIPLLRGGYNGNTTPDHLVYAWKQYLQKDKYPEVLFPYGYGDGGGGPTFEMVETVDRVRDYPGLPTGRTGGEETFFQEAQASGLVTDLWTGELYLETHRGTYTTHADAKTGNRCCELALRDAEILGSLSAWLNEPVDMSILKEAWELTLVNQFHDILPGSSISAVYDDMRKDHAQVLETAKKVTSAAIEGVTRKDRDSNLCLINTTSWNRSDPVRVCLPSNSRYVSMKDTRGEQIISQLVNKEDGSTELVFEPENIPGFGAISYQLDEGPSTQETPFKVELRRMESPLYILELAEDGSIERLFDRKVGRDVVSEKGRLNEFRFYQDGPEGEAAWNIHATYKKARYEQECPAEFEIMETGPVYASLRVTRRFRDSVFVQEIRLYRNHPRIDFVTRATWQERQTLLKASFDVAVRAGRSTSEIQFGALERVTHMNTSWQEEKFEVCSQRWVDLSESGYGVSLLNDGRYGHDFEASRMGITLLRGPEAPDPKADLGEHEFTYSLLPHKGDWVDAGTVFAAGELNIPLLAVQGRCPRTSDPWLTLSGLSVVADTLKPAEDGDGWILRLYEPHGARGTALLRFGLSMTTVTETNLVEENERDLPLKDRTLECVFLPYQIRTLRLKKT